MADVTITVDRADLDRVLACVDAATTHADAAADRIRAAIPEPPWEPSEAMVEALMASVDHHRGGTRERPDMAKAVLIDLHDAGFDLTLREGP